METPRSVPATDRPWRFVSDAERMCRTSLILVTGNKWERNLPARILPCTLITNPRVVAPEQQVGMLIVAQMRNPLPPTDRRGRSDHKRHVYVIRFIANEAHIVIKSMAGVDTILTIIDHLMYNWYIQSGNSNWLPIVQISRLRGLGD